MCTNFYQIKFTKSIIEKSDSPIRLSAEFYAPQKFKYTSYVDIVIDGVIVISIPNNT